MTESHEYNWVVGKSRCFTCKKEFVDVALIRASFTKCDCGSPAGFMYRSPRIPNGLGDKL